MAATYIKYVISVNLLLSLIFFTMPALGQQNTESNSLSFAHTQLSGYKSKVSLLGTRWALKSIKGRELSQGTIVTIQFLDRTHFTGSDECSMQGWGRYTLYPGNRLAVQETGNHQIGCAGNIGSQEYEYTIKLLGVTNYKIEGEVLSLSNEAKGILLQYQLLPNGKTYPQYLFGKTWQLESATGMQISDPNPYTLHFSADQFEFDGRTICRNYIGEYHLVDEVLGVFFTRRKVGFWDYFFCSDNDTRAEENYLELLKNVWRYEASKTQLVLYADHDKKLVFKLVGK